MVRTEIYVEKLHARLIKFTELFFCKKKIPLSRRVEYVMDGSMDHSVSELASE